MTVDIRVDLEEQLSDTLHFLRRALPRPATRVEIIEALLMDLPTGPGADLNALAEKINERRHADPRR